MLELQHQDHQKSLPHESIRRTHVKGGPTSLGSTCKQGWERHGTHLESWELPHGRPKKPSQSLLTGGFYLFIFSASSDT